MDYYNVSPSRCLGLSLGLHAGKLLVALKGEIRTVVLAGLC
jgi:hypothetical protein